MDGGKKESNEGLGTQLPKQRLEDLKIAGRSSYPRNNELRLIIAAILLHAVKQSSTAACSPSDVIAGITTYPTSLQWHIHKTYQDNLEYPTNSLKRVNSLRQLFYSLTLPCAGAMHLSSAGDWLTRKNYAAP